MTYLRLFWEFFKDKEPDFSEEGWARRKPKK